MFGLKTTAELAAERKAEDDRQWNREREEEAAHRRKQDSIKDKSPRPTLAELNAMSMSEELPILNYHPGELGQAWNSPGMKSVGHVCRVPGGWLYQFSGLESITSQFVPLGGE